MYANLYCYTYIPVDTYILHIHVYTMGYRYKGRLLSATSTESLSGFILFPLFKKILSIAFDVVFIAGCYCYCAR